MGGVASVSLPARDARPDNKVVRATQVARDRRARESTAPSPGGRRLPIPLTTDKLGNSQQVEGHPKPPVACSVAGQANGLLVSSSSGYVIFENASAYLKE